MHHRWQLLLLLPIAVAVYRSCCYCLLLLPLLSIAIAIAVYRSCYHSCHSCRCCPLLLLLPTYHLPAEQMAHARREIPYFNILEIRPNILDRDFPRGTTSPVKAKPTPSTTWVDVDAASRDRG